MTSIELDLDGSARSRRPTRNWPQARGACAPLPPRPAAFRRLSAIVPLPGPVGEIAERGYRDRPPLASLGVAVLVVETYASSPDLGRSFIGRPLRGTARRRRG